MPELTWKETRPARWERPLSCLEKINLVNRNIDKALDRDNWAKTAVAKLEFDPALGNPEEALRIAWKQVRYNFPEVAAFPYNGIYMYRTGHPEQIDLWVTATFSVVEDGKSVDDLLGHIPRNEQMMCYYLPHTSEVLIRSPHYRLDARGAILCLNHLIAALSKRNPVIVFGGCAKNLSPSIDSALDIPYKYTAKIEEAAAKRLTSLESHYPPLNLRPTVKSNLPGFTKRTLIKLSPRETKAVTSGCASSSLHLTTALHAALIAAVAKLAPPAQTESFMASFHCDLRPLITKPVSTRQAPTSCTSTITTEVKVGPKSSYRSYYDQLLPAYERGYRPFLESTACYHERLAEAKYGDGRANAKAEGQPQPRFGALGDIGEQLTKEIAGVVRVRDFWLGTETLTERMMVHSWVWEGSMVFSCCFNESFWDVAFVQRLLGGIRDTLVSEVALVGLMNGVSV
ncbi:hypothetical protein BS50DRAFT_579941 [Corynespora cassiicola Philippines]|uniref:Uncharacterized protein n=1 Tax=Corynespora cassiicola Philippines TaxID=1448308 RepID=A0A2T2N281_CORCC|nr:hypothetical protein BS50DRAFT_579941 [Corynespora cassiicola Philippines]